MQVLTLKKGGGQSHARVRRTPLKRQSSFLLAVVQGCLHPIPTHRSCCCRMHERVRVRRCRAKQRAIVSMPCSCASARWMSASPQNLMVSRPLTNQTAPCVQADSSGDASNILVEPKYAGLYSAWNGAVQCRPAQSQAKHQQLHTTGRTHRYKASIECSARFTQDLAAPQHLQLIIAVAVQEGFRGLRAAPEVQPLQRGAGVCHQPQRLVADVAAEGHV